MVVREGRTPERGYLERGREGEEEENRPSQGLQKGRGIRSSIQTRNSAKGLDPRDAVTREKALISA